MTEEMTFTNQVMWAAAEAVGAVLEKHNVTAAHFALLVFTPDGVNYIGTGTRESIASAMQEVLNRWHDPHDAVPLSPSGGNDAVNSEGSEDQAGDAPDLRPEKRG